MKKYNIVDVKTMEYWKDRAEIRDRKYVRDVKALERKLKQEYVSAKKEIQKEINSYYLSLEEDISEYEKYESESK